MIDSVHAEWYTHFVKKITVKLPNIDHREKRKVSDDRRFLLIRWKGKQVWILYELVTVIREGRQKPLGNREGVGPFERSAGRPALAKYGNESSGHEELAVRKENLFA